jgi:ATP-dependent Zn protease
MLAEMDRTEKGIFVLCATNYPDKIDAAFVGWAFG